MAMQYPSVLFILLLLSTPFSRAFRLYKSRADALALLEATEGRLYFNSCEQSSNRASCVFAIDTGYSQEPSQCSLTKSEDRPWWLAVLETPAYVSKVTVLNIDNAFRSYQDALSNIVIMANDEVCFRYQSDDIFIKRSFPCDALADQIVIQSNLNSAVLGICDVEIMGAPLKFPTALDPDIIILLAECKQSSVEGNGFCENALDTLKGSNHQKTPCAVTNAEESPWFEVLFGMPSLVTEIRLFNRADSGADGLQNFQITLNERMCAQYESAPFESMSFRCKYFGNRLRVSSNQAKAMSICEIELLGHQAALIGIMRKPTFKELGCYKDVAEDRDLTQLVSSMLMSYGKCYRMCKRVGMKYFGVQYGKYCFCGSSFGKHGSVPNDMKCSFSCNGLYSRLELQACGGELINRVFEIN